MEKYKLGKGIKALPNKACTGQVGFVAIFRQFSGFEFFLHLKQNPRPSHCYANRLIPPYQRDKILTTMENKVNARTSIWFELPKCKQVGCVVTQFEMLSIR